MGANACVCCCSDLSQLYFSSVKIAFGNAKLAPHFDQLFFREYRAILAHAVLAYDAASAQAYGTPH
jgi:hypothetical protein